MMIKELETIKQKHFTSIVELLESANDGRFIMIFSELEKMTLENIISSITPAQIHEVSKIISNIQASKETNLFDFYIWVDPTFNTGIQEVNIDLWFNKSKSGRAILLRNWSFYIDADYEDISRISCY